MPFPKVCKVLDAIDSVVIEEWPTVEEIPQ